MKACLMLIIFYKTNMLKKSTFVELRGFEGVTDQGVRYKHFTRCDFLGKT